MCNARISKEQFPKAMTCHQVATALRSGNQHGIDGLEFPRRLEYAN